MAKRGQEIQQIEHLKCGVAGNAVVTAYHSRPTDQRLALCRGRYAG